MSRHQSGEEGMEEHFRQREQQVPRPETGGDFACFFFKATGGLRGAMVGSPPLLCIPTLFLLGQPGDLNLEQEEDPSF